MTYQKSLDYLNSLSNSGIKFGLENTRIVLEYFGNPQSKIPAIHIAGTNGKGSVAAYTESILRAAGYHTGLYTSPHFLDFRERIQINRELITCEDMARLSREIRKALQKLNVLLTYFEFGTVLAFLYFAEQNTDLNVIEVGLGGRLDATNLCYSLVSILTSISMDHEQFLGVDLGKIAFEKASIIRRNGTVIADFQVQEVEDEIGKLVNERHASWFRNGIDFQADRVSFNDEKQKLDFRLGNKAFNNIEIPLLGRHQVHNAALAITGCLDLNNKGFSISESHIREGLLTCWWEGRLEVIQNKPKIILDGAHNPESAKNLTANIREYFSYRKCTFIVGLMRDKPIEKIAYTLSKEADKIILTKPRQDRAENPENLIKIFHKYHKVIEIIEEIPYALSIAKKMASSDDLICVTGSLFAVAEAKPSFAHESFT